MIKKEKDNYFYINKCEGCGKEFRSQKSDTRFHSEDCMKKYYEEKYGKKDKLLPLKNGEKGL